MSVALNTSASKANIPGILRPGILRLPKCVTTGPPTSTYYADIQSQNADDFGAIVSPTGDVVLNSNDQIHAPNANNQSIDDFDYFTFAASSQPIPKT